MNSFPQREKSTPLHFKYITMCSFSQGEFESFLRHIAAFRSDHQLGADVLLKLLALDQLLRTNEQDEGTLGRTEHTVDLVDTDVAVLGGLLGGEGQLEVNGNSFDLIVFHGFDSFHQSKDVDGFTLTRRRCAWQMSCSSIWRCFCGQSNESESEDTQHCQKEKYPGSGDLAELCGDALDIPCMSEHYSFYD